ncbi:MAG: DMT family transporter [Thermoanaerobaculia bacterium]
MSGTLAVMLIAIAAGIAVALQGQFMALMNRTVGTATGVVITYGTGAIVAVLFWLTRRDAHPPTREIPWYAWTAGALGLIIVGGIGYAAPRLGLSRTIILTIAAQLAAAMLIDHFGLFHAQPRGMDVPRAVGFALTIGGAWLIVK